MSEPQWTEHGRVRRFGHYGTASVAKCPERPRAYRWYFRVVNGAAPVASGYAATRALARQAARYAIGDA